MNTNLTLFYSSRVYLNLIENIPLEEIDELTIEYKNQEEILGSELFADQINAFYVYTSNYRRKIKNPEARKGKICITYFDHNNKLQILRVIYNKDKIKHSPKKMVNSINQELKEANNNQIVLALFNHFNFIFETEYNRIYHKLYRLKKDLSYTVIPTKQQKTSYNRLLKIIKEELNKGYNPSTDKTTSLSYYHIRLVDEFLEETQNIKTIPKNNSARKDSQIPISSEINIPKTDSPKSLVKSNKSLYSSGDTSWKN